MEVFQSLGEILAQAWQLVVSVAELFVTLLSFLLYNALLIFYILLGLLAIDWKRTWPTLAQGAWVPVVLLMLVAAMVWNKLEPGYSYWWHLGGVTLVVLGLLFLGWLQGLMNLTPPDWSYEPKVEAGHDHGHGGHH